METNVNYTLVGAFVIFLIAAIVLTIIWLSAGFSFEINKTYLVYMKESVSGLARDSVVEYNGVNVGTVTDLRLNKKNPQMVEVYLSIHEETPITYGTVATLNSRGITGITYIALKDDSTDLRPLVKLKGQPYPVIKTSPSLFLRLDIALNQFSKNFTRISEAVQKLLDEENLHSLKLTLQNLERISGNLAQNSRQFDAIFNNMAKLTHQFSPLLQSSTSVMHMVETQTLPSTFNLISNLEAITQSLKEVSNQLKENPSMLIRGKGTGTLGPGETNSKLLFGPGEK